MCGSCQAFQKDWEAARELLEEDGTKLHWAEVNIDFKENVELANKMGVLEEGIPNVKLLNAAEDPMNVVTGDTPTAEAVAANLRTSLQTAGAIADAAGFYRGSHIHSEL